MSGGDWLWDKSGAPDPEVQRLERALARYRHVPEPLRVPRSRAPLLALAAALLAVLGGAVWWWLASARPERAGASSSGYVVHGVPGTERLGRGERLETRGAESARIELGAIGHVDVAPGSALRVEAIDPAAHHLYLERGRIEAQVIAQPRLFQVGTPSGRSIDLGCAYVLTVDEDGRSRLRVTSGQVAFVHGDREVYVPTSAVLTADPARGPDAPVFEDANPAFVQALAMLSTKGKLDPVSVAYTLVEAAEREDSLTLWHLFDDPRTDPLVAKILLDKLLQAFPLPPGVTEEGVYAGDRAMRDAWKRSIEPAWRRQG